MLLLYDTKERLEYLRILEANPVRHVWYLYFLFFSTLSILSFSLLSFHIFVMFPSETALWILDILLLNWIKLLLKWINFIPCLSNISFAPVLPSSYQDILPTGTEILSPGILSYLYWDFVPWDFVPWDSVRTPNYYTTQTQTQTQNSSDIYFNFTKFYFSSK